MEIRLLSLSAFVVLILGFTSALAQSFTDVALGSAHICAINGDSEVECTTASAAERYDAPEGLPLMSDIAAGDQHTCGIDRDGQAVCWGGENFGAFDQLRVPDIPQPLVSIGAGDNHTCAVDVNGQVWCWGLDTNQQAQPPGDGFGVNGGGFVQVDGGVNFSCGIQTDGDVACWTSDTRMGDTSNIPGPFVDIDLSFNNACGLKDDGTIECWFGPVAPPANGPYTDLVVSRFAVCGLNQDQTVDCNFDSRISTDEAVFPQDVRFTAIESGSEVFSPVSPFCGITVSGSIECSSSGQFAAFSPPGSADDAGQDLSTLQLALTARRYSSNQIELFWNSRPERFGSQQILIEVYRNDILVDTTENSSSWYDASEQTQNPAVYTIRPIDRLGNVGPFSDTVFVDNDSGIVTTEEVITSFDLVQPLHTVDSLRFVRSGNTAVVTWAGSVPGTNGLKGYEVRLNNEAIAFNNGFFHRLESFNTDVCNEISVAAVSEEGTIFDYRTIVLNRFSRNFDNCTGRV